MKHRTMRTLVVGVVGLAVGWNAPRAAGQSFRVAMGAGTERGALEVSAPRELAASSATPALDEVHSSATVVGLAGSLRVLSLNTWLLSTPIFVGGDTPCRKGRGRLLGRMLAQGVGSEDYDVVMLQELFDNGAKDRVIEEVSAKYPYQLYKKPGASGLDINGGGAILSKYPFLPVWYHPLYGTPRYYYDSAWDECDSDDCHAQKGWVHVRIDYGGIPVNVFSLHSQANYADGGDNYTWTQQEQMKQLQQYIDGFPYSYFAADLSRELMVLGGDYNVLAHCSGCKMTSDYMSVSGILGMREAWREAQCYLGSGDSAGEYTWGTNGEGWFNAENGATKPSREERLDMILYDDSESSSYEIRPRDVAVNNFYIGPYPSIACNDDGNFSEPYPSEYVSDHFGVEATLDIYSAAYAPAENTQCGPIPSETATGNPFQYTRDRDEYLSCYGMAGRISSNCRDVSDYNDKQMCYAMSTSSQSPCTTMTIRDLQLACYGMSIGWASNCDSIKDAQMRTFCQGVSAGDGTKCTSLTNRDTQLLCYALSYGVSSNCRDITGSNDRNFCYGVSSQNSSYCASIQ